MAATSISFDLILRLREFYTMAYQEISLDNRKQATPDNGRTDYAIPSYILAVATVEAFMNESFLAFGPGFLKGSSFDQLSEKELENLRKANLEEKLLKIPELAFDQKVFDAGRQPLQGMSHLIRVRNAFVHYKMSIDVEHRGTLDYLVQKGIAINSKDGPNRFWVSDLSTLEGIRWAHNTAVVIIRAILDTAIATNRHPILIQVGASSKNYFHQIPDINQQDIWRPWMRTHTKWEKIKPKVSS